MFRPPKPKAQAEYLCPHCNKPCGWTKNEIAAIRSVTADLKCQNKECGKVAIKMLHGSVSHEVITPERKGGNGKPKKLQYMKGRKQNAA
jgi:hypothetical protein